MPAFHFFTNATSLNAQGSAQRYGPVSGSETSHFRVTSLFSSSAVQNAYAVCGGKVFAQEAGSRINLVLKPDAQPSGLAAPVKYYIYKGLKKDFFIDSANAQLVAPATKSDLTDLIHQSQIRRNQALDRLTNAHAGTTTTPPPISALGLHLKPAAAAPNTLLDAVFVDDVFERLDDDEFPTVAGGKHLGEFDPVSFGFEIVLDSVGDGPTMDTVRSAATEVSAGSAGTTEADRFRQDRRREQILDYIDPCSFYAMFFFDGVQVKGAPSDPFLLLARDALYDAVLAKFATADTIYLDIRNEHNHGFNFYRSYNSALGAPAQIRVRYDGGTSNAVDYESHGWPILAIPTNVFTEPKASIPSRITLNLPKGDNTSPIVLRTQGYFSKGFKRMPKTAPDVSETLRPVFFEPDDFTIDIAFAIPKLTNNKTVPSSIGIRYLKRIGFTTAPADPNHRVLPAKHFIDNLFELNALLSSTGLEIPLNTNDLSRWHNTGRTAVLAPNTAAGRMHLATVGIGDDPFNVYFFASAPTARLVTGSSNTRNPINAFGDAYALDLELRRAFVPDVLQVQIEVPLETPPRPRYAEPSTAFSTFNIDEEATLILALTLPELTTLRVAASALSSSFDRRLALRNRVESKDGNGVVTAVQYDLCVVGYTLGASVTVTEINTLLKVRQKADSDAWLGSAGAIANLPPFDPIETNRKRFAGSRIGKGTIVNLRDSPRLPKSNQTSNLLLETEGNTHRVTVLGKLVTIGDNEEADPAKTEKVDRTWYYVELLDPIVTAAKSLPAGQRCWIGISFPIVSPLAWVISDLVALDRTLDSEQPMSLDTVLQRITRLRMRTAEEGDISTLFDAFINSGPLPPPAPVRLHEQPEAEPIPRVLVDSYHLETTIRVFEDYMETTIGNQLIDLHHLFIGMDVVHHENTNTLLEPEDVTILGWIIEDQLVGNNIDATTWAGDIGAIPADSFLDGGFDTKWQAYWIANHPGMDASHREQAFLNHYWETRAKEEDLYADVYCHYVRDRILKLSPNDPIERSIPALLYHVHRQLQRGDRQAFEIFAKRLHLNPADPKPYADYATVINDAGFAIFLFSRLWYLHRDHDLPSDDLDTTLRNWGDRLARVFLQWLQDRR